jgi:hypothetical protein
VKTNKKKELNLSDEEIADLIVMRDHFWQEDTATRQQQLQKWRRLKFFWNNISNVWYDSVAHDWRIWNADNLNGDGDSDQQYYDQRINIFRAYLESIFAAISVLVPPVKAYPDDAENSDDLETAKAGDKIAAILYRHNEAPMLWLHNLFVWGTEGLVCGYNYTKHDKEYGTYKVDEYEEDLITHDVTSCPSCGFEIDDTLVTPEQLQMEELQAQMQSPMPNEGMGQEQELMPEIPQMQDDMMAMEGTDICPSCQQIITPQIERVNEIIPRLVGSVNEPKGRVCLESYGGLNVKTPLYARKQSEVLYLFYMFEEHYAQSIQKYPKLHEKLGKQYSGNQSGSFDSYEQWARLNTEYRGEYPVNCVTNKTVWFKVDAYNILSDERSKHWHKKFKNGISATFINDLFACAKEEALDDHWTLEYNPLSDFLSHDPLGMLLTSCQEITNDLLSLTKQTIEHGVGLTFVDPQIVDLNAYSKTEVNPGALIPTKPISGSKKIADGFFEIKTATLSGEVMPFGEQVQGLAQLASGAMPALFGRMDSDTASQDSMSKNQAQSRLGLQWKTKCNWWKNFIGKAIQMYITIIQYDERDVQKRDDGSFINIVIKKSELNGKIGRVELEANENLPLSWSQKKDVIMQLLLSPNPSILQMLMQPENLPVLREAIGLDNFFIPGADDVDKQWAEIKQLISSQPIETGDALMPMAPSIEVDELFDTHPIQFEICRKWAVSEVGQYYKYNHPAEYQNVLLHAKQHLDAMNAGQPMNEEGNPEEKGQPNQEKPQLNNKDAPITGDVDVPLAQ